MTARPADVPVPGNPPAIYALTGIHATARQLEGILKYAAGARRPGLLSVRGDSDANTLKALDAICGLIGIADDDLYRLVVSELEQRLNEAQQVRAIDEAEQWRYVQARACPRCGCFALRGAPRRGQASCGACRVLRARRVRGAVPGDMDPPRRYRPGPGAGRRAGRAGPGRVTAVDDADRELLRQAADALWNCSQKRADREADAGHALRRPL